MASATCFCVMPRSSLFLRMCSPSGLFSLISTDAAVFSRVTVAFKLPNATLLLRCLFPRWETSAKKPKLKEIPKVLVTIGDHIRKRRLELGLLQKDVAALLGCHEASVYKWENGHSVPQIHFNPLIISFLGYVPFSIANETLSQRLKSYRALNGISHEQMGILLGVDGSTISSWENNVNLPKKATLEKLNELLCT